MLPYRVPSPAHTTGPSPWAGYAGRPAAPSASSATRARKQGAWQPNPWSLVTIAIATPLVLAIAYFLFAVPPGDAHVPGFVAILWFAPQLLAASALVAVVTVGLVAYRELVIAST